MRVELTTKQRNQGGENLAGLLSNTREDADGHPWHCKSTVEGITRELWHKRQDCGRGWRTRKVSVACSRLGVLSICYRFVVFIYYYNTK